MLETAVLPDIDLGLSSSMTDERIAMLHDAAVRARFKKLGYEKGSPDDVLLHEEYLDKLNRL